MKEYESEIIGSSKLNPEKPFIVRLDGHRFSKFTSGFKKPFDERIFRAMMLTTSDLVDEYNPTLGYTQSDEITLTFTAFKTNEPQKEGSDVIMFNGRIQKLISLMSGFCSVRFAYHMSSQTYDHTESELVEKIHKAHFDARVFHLPSNTELLNNVIWRIKDVKRNSVNNLGHCHFKQKDVQGVNPAQVREKLVEKGIFWEEMPDPYKFGIIVKKGKFDKEGYNPMTNTKIIVQRTKLCFCSLDEHVLKSAEKLVSEKLVNDCDDLSKHFIEIT